MNPLSLYTFDTTLAIILFASFTLEIGVLVFVFNKPPAFAAIHIRLNKLFITEPSAYIVSFWTSVIK